MEQSSKWAQVSAKDADLLAQLLLRGDRCRCWARWVAARDVPGSLFASTGSTKPSGRQARPSVARSRQKTPIHLSKLTRSPKTALVGLAATARSLAGKTVRQPGSQAVRCSALLATGKRCEGKRSWSLREAARGKKRSEELVGCCRVSCTRFLIPDGWKARDHSECTSMQDKTRLHPPWSPPPQRWP